MDPNESALKGMLGPVREAARALWSLVPKDIDLRKRPHFNFITVHYMYIVGWSIACSIMLFGNGFMSYIDAIFFAAGATTQSGLNPININDLYLYQQVVMMLVACVCNPIFINTAVVFVRLYWFEKRFERVVKESREQRKSRSRISRSKSQMADAVTDDDDPGRLEKGVNGRQIRVLHHTTKPNGMSGKGAPHGVVEQKDFAEKMGLAKEMESDSPSASSESHGGGPAENSEREEGGEKRKDGGDVSHDRDEDEDGQPTPQPFHRDIMFADELPTPSSLTAVTETGAPTERTTSRREQMAEHNEMSKHIEFLQRQQRDAQTGTAIRIPGPRDFDRGEVPQALETPPGEKQNHLAKTETGSTTAGNGTEVDRINDEKPTEHINLDDHGPERTGNIRFDDQQHPAHRDWALRPSTEQPGDGSASGAGPRHDTGKLRSRQSRLSLNEARETIGRTFSTFTTARSRDKLEMAMPYLSYEPTIGRNSAFLALTAEQRDELGGIEYRSLKTLAKVLIIYYVGFHTFGMLMYVPWIIYTHRWRQVVVGDGILPGWWGVFTSASAFTDLGFTLTPNSMNSFAQSTLVLLTGAFLIIIGNTGFPVMLRFVIWISSKIVPYGGPTWEELRFLLDHPRRCFTLLFPSRATWWLFWILVLLNGIDLIFYIILDFNVSVVDKKPPNYRVLDGFFQATSTRTAGFSCVNLADLHPAIQVSYMVMMYISVFPIAISVRRTNVYEERSLGIWGGEEVAADEANADQSYVPQHVRRQLSFDLWYIFLGFFIICIVEGGPLQANEKGWSLFNILFEIVSAYGTVGLSLGFPGVDTSFSAQFKILSKLVIIAMMIRGRHRGLPYALDRAILLPSENLQKKEQEDAERRFARRGSVFAEGNMVANGGLRRGESWSDYELDDSGLPKQHLGLSRPTSVGVSRRGPDGGEVDPSAQGSAAAAAAAGERNSGAGLPFSPTLSRRASAYSTGKNNNSLADPAGVGVSRSATGRTHERRRSLSRMLAGGLGAGPTLPKRD